MQVRQSILFTTLVLGLQGCGSDNDTRYNSQPSFDTEWSEYYIEPNEEASGNTLTKFKNVQKNNMYYAYRQPEYVADKDWSSPRSKLYYLTEKSLIDPNIMYDGQPALEYKVSQQTNTQMSLTPLHNHQASHLELQKKYKLIDLSGQSIAEHLSQQYIGFNQDPVAFAKLDTDLQKMIKRYIQQFQNTHFPNGAQCLILQTEVANEDYVLYSEDPIEGFISVEDELGDDYEVIYLGSETIYKSNASFIDSLAYRGLIQRDSIWYSVNYYKKGTTFDLTYFKNRLKQEIEKSTQGLGADALSTKYLTLLLSNLGQQCEFYNKVASAEIDRVQKIKP